MQRALRLGARGAAAGGAALYALSGASAAQADVRPAAQPSSEAPAPTEAQLALLHDWLRARGAGVDGVRVSASEHGLGLFAAPEAAQSWRLPRLLRPGYWLGWPGRTLAEFPLSCAVCAHSCAADPALGPLLSAWLREGALSEREAVMLWLLVQRALGAQSAAAPYVSLLPSTPPAPLWWRDEELKELAGTTLWEAVRAQARGLEGGWARLAPLARQAARQAGCPDARAMSLEDWRWAVGTYWSRALAYPDPAVAEALPVGAPPPPLSEGVVPGLDFANHGGPRSSARWTVLGARAGGSRLPAQPSFGLQERGAGVPPASELRIDYGGGRSNEELLFTYGFAVADNAADALMVAPPLPRDAEGADQLALARAALLHARGREPRAFLPQAGRRAAQAAVEEALQVLSPFTLSPAELGCALEEHSSTAGLSQRHRRQALMLLLRTLEQRVAAMAATGTLQQDDALLRTELQPRRRAAVLYRRTQKALGREYLELVKRMLADCDIQTRP